MSIQVVLTATKGILEGQEFVFTGETQCVLGRSQTCDVRAPAEDCTVSRRHCLLDIDAQTVTVQDLGSLNGTFLNEGLIGHREKSLDPEEAAALPHNRITVEDGDELRIGANVFRVQIIPQEMQTEIAEKAGSNCLICI